MRWLSRPGRTAALAPILVLALAASSRANVLVDCSFEQGPDPGAAGAIRMAAGSTAIPGWVVTGANIDYTNGNWWTPAQGARSIGLNGSGPGGVAQTFPTIIHAQYTAVFWMAGDPGTLPNVKWLRASAAGQSQDFSVDITDMWAWDPGWAREVFTFTANASSTTLEFVSLMSGDYGPSLDSVDVSVSSMAGVDPPGPAELMLAPIAPNPSAGPAHADFSLAHAGHVVLSVMDLSGREVARLADERLEAGPHRRTWDATDRGSRAAPGIYFLRLWTPDGSLARRLVLMR
jgi:choice-of-anchor C domain-containing protein